MTNIDFPDNPSLNDTYSYGDVIFRYDGTRWTLNGATEFILAENKIFVGDSNGIARAVDFLIGYSEVKSELKSFATLSNDNVDLSASGGGKITLSANTAFTFSGFQINKTYLLEITTNGYTPSFAVAARHVLIEGNAEFDTTSTFYVNLTCIDATASSEKLITTIMKKA